MQNEERKRKSRIFKINLIFARCIHTNYGERFNIIKDH